MDEFLESLKVGCAMFKKIISAMFVALLLIGSASAGSYTKLDQQNIEMDGNFGPTDC